MTLGFSTHWPDKTPTLFREKILLPYDTSIQEQYPDMIPKIHTFRQGVERWDAGMTIHMVTGNRTRNRNQFNTDIPELELVKSIQFAQISIIDGILVIHIDEENGMRELSTADTLLFAANDGFNSVEEMRSWFFPKRINKYECAPYGVIIHWTDLKY